MKLSNPKNTKNILLLIFVFLICWRHVFSRTQEDDRVIKLPGQPNSPQVSQFSGYITVNKTHGRALFYWFFQSQFDSSKKPLLLWLNGGPGCSSIGYGASVELGPLLVQNNGAGLDFNEHSWNKEANLLFLESPVGVGFSYTNTSSDFNNLDDDFAAEDAYNFLVNWLERFPEFKNREFFISGESYAGHYVPQLAELVYNRNKDSKNYPYINLKGFIVGNPETNDYYDYNGILEYAWSHAILYDSEYQKAKQECDFKLSNWSNACVDAMQVLWDKYNEIDIYNIYGPKCLVNTSSSSASDIVNTHDASQIKAPNYGFRRMKRIPGGYDPCYTSFTEEYFNRLDVQIALHASTEGTQARNKWKSCSDPVFNTYNYDVFSVLPVYERLIKGGLKIWIFSGDVDGRVPVIGTRDCVEALNLTLKSPWHSWFLNKQMMVNEGLVPCGEEEMRRRNAIDKLKKIVVEWVKTVTYQRGLPKKYLKFASGTILTYGSYGLGVYNSESDIDALCVGPYFATIAEDFFIVLHNMLASRPEVSEIHCVKDAKVPLMRFKFDGISIDLPYARLKVISIPDNVDVFNPFFLKNIDDTSWKSLSGVRANRSILHLVPNIEVFQSVLRCIKLWAKRRGVYGNLLGFFGGIHLAVLSAFICRRHPSACLSTLVLLLFKTFALWPWPTPVILQDQIARPFIPNHDKVSWMPIQLPCSPYEFCHSNITRSTFYKIRTEFLRGHMLTKDMLSLDFDWNILFEPFPYARRYGLFVKIFLSACGKDELGDWVGWVKSRFRCLLVKLEELFGFCDPNPTEYVDTDASEPNVIFYWGLPTGRADLINADLVEEYFLKSIDNGLNQRSAGTIKLSIVKAYQLPKKADQLGALERKNTKPCWRVVNGNRKKTPPQPKYKPHCADDYLPTNENTEYPSAGG